MTAPRLLRALAALDAGTAFGMLVLSSWLGDQVDVGVTPIRVAAGVLLVLGVDTYLLAERPVMVKVRLVSEALCALLAVDLVVLGEPSGIGAAILLGTALLCAAVAVELALLTRTRALTPA
jgi:hypothetical protein